MQFGPYIVDAIGTCFVSQKREVACVLFWQRSITMRDARKIYRPLPSPPFSVNGRMVKRERERDRGPFSVRVSSRWRHKSSARGVRDVILILLVNFTQRPAYCPTNAILCWHPPKKKNKRKEKTTISVSLHIDVHIFITMFNVLFKFYVFAVYSFIHTSYTHTHPPPIHICTLYIYVYVYVYAYIIQDWIRIDKLHSLHRSRQNLRQTIV